MHFCRELKDESIGPGVSVELSPIEFTRKSPKLFGYRTMSQNAKQEKIRMERSRNKTRKDESMPIVIYSAWMTAQKYIF